MPLSKEQIQTIRKQNYEPFRKKLDAVEDIVQAGHESWWFRTMLFLKRFERFVATNPDVLTPEMKHFYESVLPMAIQHLSAEVSSELSTALGAHEAVLRISEEIPRSDALEHEPAEVRSLSLEEIVEQYPAVSFAEWETNGRQGRALQILDSKGEPHLFPLPEADGIYHKGGFPRVLVKIIAGADQALIDAELPPNDFDIIADPNLDTELIESEAAYLNVDADGIEHVAALDFSRLLLERDLDINMAFVGKDAIYFAPQAVEAAQTGKIEVMSAHRGIYGTEFFVYDGEVLLKNRGLMRLFKTVAEGKATSFEFKPLNENITFGIYWLVLFRKFAAKDDAALYLDRLFDLAKQTNQLPEGATNIIEVLDKAHEKYPFFDFDAGPLDEVGVARWLSKKLLRQIDASYRHTNQIPNELLLERNPGDADPYTVNLDDYTPDPERLAWIQSEIENFHDRCRARTRAFKEMSDSASLYDSDD